MELPQTGNEKGPGKGSEAAGGLEKAVGRRVPAEDLYGPGGEQDGVSDPEEADDGDQADDRPDHRVPPDISDAFLEVGDRGGLFGFGDEGFDLHAGESRDDGNERDAVDREAPGRPEERIDHPGYG